MSNHRISGRERTRRREIFPALCVIALVVALAFICCAIGTIIAGGAAHVREVTSSAEVLFSLRMSVVTSLASTAICLLLALPTGYALTRTRMPFKRAVETVLELTLSLPYIVLGFALLIMFSSPFGQALKSAGVAVVFQPLGIVVAQTIVNLPFAIRLVRTAFSDSDPRMEFVAKTLGASSLSAFATVLVPSCRNALISCAILTWARGMGEFGATLMLVGVTRMRTETLPGSIFLSISTGNYDTAMATAMIMLIVSALTLALANALGSHTATRVSSDGRKRARRRGHGR
jgi:molybdate transport system permease protein